MKVNTILKAGTLAFDIFNHKSTQALGGLVRNGIKRRSSAFGVPSTIGKAPEETEAVHTESRAEPSFLDRLFTPPSIPMQRMPQHPSIHHPGPHSGPRHAPYGGGFQGAYRGPYANQRVTPTQPLPTEHIKKALKYVTPENMQKAMQWHGIIKSFISKD